MTEPSSQLNTVVTVSKPMVQGSARKSSSDTGAGKLLIEMPMLPRRSSRQKLMYCIHSGSSSPKRVRYSAIMACAFTLPPTEAMLAKIAFIGSPGTRRGTKKTTVIEMKTVMSRSRKRLPM